MIMYDFRNGEIGAPCMEVRVPRLLCPPLCFGTAGPSRSIVLALCGGMWWPCAEECGGRVQCAEASGGALWRAVCGDCGGEGASANASPRGLPSVCIWGRRCPPWPLVSLYTTPVSCQPSELSSRAPAAVSLLATTHAGRPQGRGWPG